MGRVQVWTKDLKTNPSRIDGSTTARFYLDFGHCGFVSVKKYEKNKDDILFKLKLAPTAENNCVVLAAYIQHHMNCELENCGKEVEIIIMTDKHMTHPKGVRVEGKDVRGTHKTNIQSNGNSKTSQRCFQGALQLCLDANPLWRLLEQSVEAEDAAVIGVAFDQQVLGLDKKSQVKSNDYDIVSMSMDANTNPNVGSGRRAFEVLPDQIEKMADALCQKVLITEIYNLMSMDAKKFLVRVADLLSSDFLHDYFKGSYYSARDSVIDMLLVLYACYNDTKEDEDDAVMFGVEEV